MYVCIFAVLQNLLYHGPINSVFKLAFYTTQPWEKDAHALINLVPPNVEIASQNSLLPYLSHRIRYHLLPDIGNSQYIAVDLSDGPNKYSPLNYQQTQTLVNKLIANGEFTVIWQKNQSILLERTQR